jgi:hypothetical protein
MSAQIFCDHIDCLAKISSVAAGNPLKRSGLSIWFDAEPGWVIPAERFERRYAALAVSDVRRGDSAYFKALHGQIDRCGAINNLPLF